LAFALAAWPLGGVNLHPQCRQTESAQDDRGLGDEIGDVVSPIAQLATGESVPEPCQKSGLPSCSWRAITSGCTTSNPSSRLRHNEFAKASDLILPAKQASQTRMR
jgi:hypothetical protein